MPTGSLLDDAAISGAMSLQTDRKPLYQRRILKPAAQRQGLARPCPYYRKPLLHRRCAALRARRTAQDPALSIAEFERACAVSMLALSQNIACPGSSQNTLAFARSAVSTSCLPLVSAPMQARCVPGRTHAARIAGSNAGVTVMMTSLCSAISRGDAMEIERSESANEDFSASAFSVDVSLMRNSSTPVP